MADQVTRGAAKLALLIALPLALIAGLVTFWGLGGFDNGRAKPGPHPSTGSTGVVTMPVPSLNPSDATMCLAFIAQLPERLRGLPQRPVSSGGNQQNAAYGDPPITVACGGPAASNPPDAIIYRLSGVCWYADESNPSGVVWVTLDRQVPIRVTFPASYRNQGEADWIQEFRSPIIAAVLSLPQLPPQCTPPATGPSPSHS